MKRDTILECAIASHRKAGERVLMRLAYNNPNPRLMGLTLRRNGSYGWRYRYVGTPRFGLPCRRAEVDRKTVMDLKVCGYIKAIYSTINVEYQITPKGRDRVASLMRRLSSKG